VKPVSSIADYQSKIIHQKSKIPMSVSYLMLGSNAGDRIDNLNKCAGMIDADAGRITSVSPVYESEPWGFEHPDWFLNQAVEIETVYSPEELLSRLQDIEEKLGRIRSKSEYEARTIDVDILFYGTQIVDTATLVIPHPRIAERMFVLEPLAGLIPEFVHPVLNRTVKYLKEHCRDSLAVRKFE
jgi:2-amino-4-hydroxy-6-hydroxymethyldihydropteridine diphosphokinase